MSVEVGEGAGDEGGVCDSDSVGEAGRGRAANVIRKEGAQFAIVGIGGAGV